MPRALRIVSRGPGAESREEAIAGFRARREVVRRAGGDYWVFEESARPSSWVEFYEADDADALRAALRQVQPPVVPDPVLQEVELR